MKRLYFGDNLEVLRESIAIESVDLLYLDPPFNSNSDYNVIFGGRKSGDTPPKHKLRLLRIHGNIAAGVKKEDIVTS